MLVVVSTSHFPYCFACTGRDVESFFINKIRLRIRILSAATEMNRGIRITVPMLLFLRTTEFLTRSFAFSVLSPWEDMRTEKMKRIQGIVRVEVSRTDRGYWIGVSDDLKIVVQSDSRDELLEDIETALELLVDDLMDSGDLEAFAARQGWTFSERQPETQHIVKEPVQESTRELWVNVPFIPGLAGRFDDSTEVVHT